MKCKNRYTRRQLEKLFSSGSYPGKCAYCFEFGERPFPPTSYWNIIWKKMSDMGCPFVCPNCNRFRFELRAIRDIVCIWPIPLPKTYVDGGDILRPENYIDAGDELIGRGDYGLVLSFGPGYYDSKEKKFIPTSDLRVGMKVVYDKTVPWRTYVSGYNGHKELVVLCGFKDVGGYVEDE